MGAVLPFAPSPIAHGEVSALSHEVADDAMELATLEVERLPTVSDPLLACAQLFAFLKCQSKVSRPSPVQTKAEHQLTFKKFVAVFGVASMNSSISMRPACVRA